MELKVNNEKVAVELENEKTLEDVVNHVTNYLTEQGYVNLNIIADGEKLLATDETWKTKPIENVQHLEVIGEQVYDFDQCNINLRTVERAVEENDETEKQLCFDIWPRQMISLNFWLNGFQMDENYFADMQKIPSLLAVAHEDHTAREQILRFVERSSKALTEKGQELDHPCDVMIETIERLQAFKEPLTNLAILFQNGQDAEAMLHMVRFTMTLQKMTRVVCLLAYNYPDVSTKTMQFMQNFSKQLDEFTHACKDKDYVLAADLAEYEMVPHLETLGELKSMLH